MAQYIIQPSDGQSAFSVEYVGDDSVRQTILGFRTMDEADAWIQTDRKRSSLMMPGVD